VKKMDVLAKVAMETSLSVFISFMFLFLVQNGLAQVYQASDGGAVAGSVSAS
jgi:hypothetical protein